MKVKFVSTEPAPHLPTHSLLMQGIPAVGSTITLALSGNTPVLDYVIVGVRHVVGEDSHDVFCTVNPVP